MNEEIDLFDLLQSIKENIIKTVIISAVIAIVGTFIVSFITKPKFESKGSVIISIKENENKSNLITDNSQKEQKIINNYAELLKTRAIANKVIKNLNLDIDYKEFQDSINIEVKPNTEIIEIEATSNNPRNSMSIVNELCEVSKENVDKIGEIESVTILDKAVEDNNPKTLSRKKIAISVFVLTFILINLILVFLNLKDQRIKSEKDIRAILNVPFLGTLPKRDK